jgi:AmiR/NasT family two-component response regulator
VALWNARTYDECGEKVRQLQEALETRIVIEQAKGILMERGRCSSDVAFEALREASQRTNRKLRMIAGEVVESVLSQS